VHVRATVEESNLRFVPPSIVIVADVTGLVKVLDAVDQESQGESSEALEVFSRHHGPGR
jgi:hypothetical protein